MNESGESEIVQVLTQIWQLLLGMKEPTDIGSVLASATVSWAQSVSGGDPRAQAAALEAFTGAVADELRARADMVSDNSPTG